MELGSRQPGPVLRLVGADGPADATPLPQGNTAPLARPAAAAAGAVRSDPLAASASARRAVERATRRAALTTDDARWVFAARVASSIDGGRAAILTPEKRQRLLTQAQRLGLRRFDANLVIAIVQDSARCGHEPLGPTTSERLPLIRQPQPQVGAELPIALRLFIATASGVAMLAALIHWVLS